MFDSETLVLDAGYLPIKAISWQKAVTLLTLGKVEVVSSHETEVRSPSLVIKIPAVVRLLRIFKRYRRPVKLSRIALFARDKYKCVYCGQKKTINELTYDHVLPKAQGGMSTWENLCAACYPCNYFKGNRTPEQAGMKLLWKPGKPDWVPAIEIQLSNRNVPDAWRDYLRMVIEI